MCLIPDALQQAYNEGKAPLEVEFTCHECGHYGMAVAKKKEPITCPECGATVTKKGAKHLPHGNKEAEQYLPKE